MSEKQQYVKKSTRNQVLTDAANAMVEMVPVYDEICKNREALAILASAYFNFRINGK